MKRLLTISNAGPDPIGSDLSLISLEELRLMKPNAMRVNTARTDSPLKHLLALSRGY